MSTKEAIIIRGARENNLKNVTITIPKQQITVFTGVSGSGKSSLVFDTIAAESQRQLNETFNAFVRNRMPHYGQPDADAMENLSVAIVINQKRIGGNARSTVGTVTKLVALMNRLVDNGSTVVVIEHNLDVISQADWIIDMGPGGGKNGGNIMFKGTPKDLLKNKVSATAEYLRRATGR